MGNGCSGKTTTVKPEPSVRANGRVGANGQTSSPPVIPYIVVSSVSLSRKIAEENMQLSVKKLPKKPNKSAPASVRRRRRHSMKPLPMQETILFEDQNHCRKMSVAMENMGDIPFLSLRISDEGVDDTKSFTKRRARSLPTSIDDTMSVDLGSVLHNHSPRRPGTANPISGRNQQTADNSPLDSQCIETVQLANKANSEPQNGNANRSDGWTANDTQTPIESSQTSELTRITELEASNDSKVVDSEEMDQSQKEKEEDLWKLPAHPVRPGSDLNSFKSPDTELNIQDMDKKMLKHTIGDEAARDVVDNIDGIQTYKDIKHYVL